MGSQVPERVVTRYGIILLVPLMFCEPTSGWGVGGKCEAFVVGNFGSYTFEIGYALPHGFYSPCTVTFTMGGEH